MKEGLMKEGMEIVLIEDNDEDAKRLLKFLRTNVTNSVRLFQDGAEAAEFLLFATDSTPKLILLDLVLPNVDGIELFKLIKSEPAQRNLSVVFLITSSKSKEYLDSIGVQPDGYLKKPTSEMSPVRLS